MSACVRMIMRWKICWLASFEIEGCELLRVFGCKMKRSDEEIKGKALSSSLQFQRQGEREKTDKAFVILYIQI